MNYAFADILGRSRWLIEPTAMKRLIAACAQGHTRNDRRPCRGSCRAKATPTIVGDIAVIDISGPITYRESFFSAFFGSATVERMQAQFRTALADSHVQAIVFRSDSPAEPYQGCRNSPRRSAAAGRSRSSRE